MAGHVAVTGSNRVHANPLRRGGGRARGGTGPTVTNSLLQLCYVLRWNFYKNKPSTLIFRCSRQHCIFILHLSISVSSTCSGVFARHERANNIVSRMVCDPMLNSWWGCRDVVVVVTTARDLNVDGGATKYFLSVWIPLHLVYQTSIVVVDIRDCSSCFPGILQFHLPSERQ